MRRFRRTDSPEFGFIEYSGVVTDGDLERRPEMEAAAGRVEKVLVDLSKVTEFKLTADAIRAAAARNKRHPQCAIVAPTPIAYGLARMFSRYAAQEDIAVFREREAAPPGSLRLAFSTSSVAGRSRTYGIAHVPR